MATQLAGEADAVLRPELYTLEATAKNTALNTVVLAPYLYPQSRTPAELRFRMGNLEERLGGLLECARQDAGCRRFAAFFLNFGLR